MNDKTIVCLVDTDDRIFTRDKNFLLIGEDPDHKDITRFTLKKQRGLNLHYKSLTGNNIQLYHFI